jgi:hypothetical protein
LKSFAIEPQSANFLRENGRMKYTKSDLEFMAQVVRHELSLFLGEWFMDESKGLPYIPKGQKYKSEHRVILETALRAKLTQIKGVKRTLSFVPLYDKRDRLYQVEFMVQTDYGVLKGAWVHVIDGGGIG